MTAAPASHSIIDRAARSIRGQSWLLREYDERAAAHLSQSLGIPELLGRMLAMRGISVEEAEDYLNPTLKHFLPDPSHLLDMDRAATRLAQAIMAGETIGIFGDYDVDGATSSALLTRFIRAAGGAEPRIHIPDRMKEGYGPNAPALLHLGAQSIRLVITVDCGTLAFEPLAAAADAGMDIVVIDHHAGEAQKPRAFALVNPNRFDETSNVRHLAAVGVAFLLVIAANRALRSAGWFGPSRREPNPLQWLDIVALGTVCDVVPLTGVNRAFVAQGLKILAARHNVGLRILMDRAGLQEAPGAYHLGFVIGPRINAGGRVGQSDLGVRLLITEDEQEAATLAGQLEHHNAERKTIEAMALESAVQQAEEKMTQDDAVLMVAAADWHPGIIGIVAGRLKERFHKPVAVIALQQDGTGKASARSVTGIDIGAAVIAARNADLLLAGGGHAMAAGFTVAAGMLPQLQQFLNAYCARNSNAGIPGRALYCDGILSAGAVTAELAEWIERAGPFGAGNPQPHFILSQARILKTDIVAEHHLRVIIKNGGTGGAASNGTLAAMAFRAVGTPLGDALMAAQGADLSLAGQIRLNHWQGRKSAQFQIEDAAL